MISEAELNVWGSLFAKIIFSIQKPVIVGIHIFSASVSLVSPLCATDHHFVLLRYQKLRMRDDSVLQF